MRRRTLDLTPMPRGDLERPRDRDRRPYRRERAGALLQVADGAAPFAVARRRRRPRRHPDTVSQWLDA